MAGHSDSLMKKIKFQLASVLIFFSFLALILMFEYTPSKELLGKSFEVSGKLYFSRSRGVTPEVEGTILQCGMDFLAEHDPCQRRVPALNEGADVTVEVVNLPALLGNVQLTKLIRQNGRLIYARTPEQVIREYKSASWKIVLFLPCILMLILVCEMTGLISLKKSEISPKYS